MLRVPTPWPCLIAAHVRPAHRTLLPCGSPPHDRTSFRSGNEDPVFEPIAAGRSGSGRRRSLARPNTEVATEAAHSGGLFASRRRPVDINDVAFRAQIAAHTRWSLSLTALRQRSRPESIPSQVRGEGQP